MFGAIGLVGKGKSPHSVRVSSRCNNYPLNNEARQSDKHRGLEYLSKIETLLNDACQLAFFHWDKIKVKLEHLQEGVTTRGW